MSAATQARWPARTLLSLLTLWATVAPAGATVGFAEHSSEYRYNDFSVLWWGHSDVCAEKTGAADNCFYFKSDPRETLLFKVSVPLFSDSPYVLAQEFVSERWVVLDLKAPAHLFEGSREDAEAFWARLGQASPTLVSADDTYFPFSQTWMSRFESVVIFGVMWINLLVYFFVLFTVAGLGFWLWEKARKRQPPA